MRFRIIQSVLACFVFLAVAVPAVPASAIDPFSGLRGRQCTDLAKDEAVICKTPTGTNPVTGPNGIIYRLARLIALIGSVIAVIVLVVGGIRFVTSGGDAEQIKRAKQTILYAVIGLVVMVMGGTIISYIMSRI